MMEGKRTTVYRVLSLKGSRDYLGLGIGMHSTWIENHLLWSGCVMRGKAPAGSQKFLATLEVL